MIFSALLSLSPEIKKLMAKKEVKVTIIGNDIRYCEECRKRTKHWKTLVKGIILFICTEAHQGKVDLMAKAKEMLRQQEAR